MNSANSAVRSVTLALLLTLTAPLAGAEGVEHPARSDTVAGNHAPAIALPKPPPAPAESRAGVEWRQALSATGALTETFATPRLRSIHTNFRPPAENPTARAPENDPGPVSLLVNKTWNGESWDLILDWSGNTGLTTVTRSISPHFDHDVETLETAFTPQTVTFAEDDREDAEFYQVTDETAASRAVLGIGYDPTPRPTEATVDDGVRAPTDKWWEDTITVAQNYLDPIAKGNYMGMTDVHARADSVELGANGYARKATFTIPRDARSFYVAPRAFGKAPAKASTFQNLVPPGVGPYTNLRTIEYSEQTGRIWVAADHVVQEIDVFKVTPTIGASFTDVTKPYISTISTNNRMLCVSGTAGVTDIYEIDVTTGVRSTFAATTDAQFTRSITPVGIALSKDGTIAYIADASAGPGYSTIVKIPRGNATDIVDDYGDWPLWGFGDPAALETDYKGHLWVAAVNNWVGEIPNETTTWWGWNTPFTAHTLQLDRDLSTPTITRVWWSGYKGYVHAYNKNAISGSIPARYHGALILNDHPGGKFVVSPLWDFMPYVYHVKYADRVILNNAGENQAYPYYFQSRDGILKLHVFGWWTVPVRVRLIDPPDLSPYVADGGAGAKPGLSAVPPYEANDNEVWESSDTDFGLTFDPEGALNPSLTHPVLQLDVTPGDGFYGVVYLKLPERYAGDNWQIEVTKLDWLGNPVPNKVPGLSGIFTGWKRFFVERERMFRTGGILSRNASVGDSIVYLARLHLNDGSWIDNDNVMAGQGVHVFDAYRPYWLAHDFACVKTIAQENQYERRVELASPSDCTTPYQLQYAYSSSVDPASHEWTYTAGSGGAGVGVTTGCNAADNVINGNSCFLTADMRAVEKTFADTYVEAIAPGFYRGEIPYMHGDWFEEATADENRSVSRVWFDNFLPSGADPAKPDPHDYFHLIGASYNHHYDGYTYSERDCSYVFVGEIELETGPPATAQQRRSYIQDVTNHELVHQFVVNPNVCDRHDTRNAWCSGAGCGVESCLMHEGRDRQNGVHRLCEGDIIDGVATGNSISCSWGQWTCTAGDGAVRTEEDPK